MAVCIIVARSYSIVCRYSSVVVVQSQPVQQRKGKVVTHVDIWRKKGVKSGWGIVADVKDHQRPPPMSPQRLLSSGPLPFSRSAVCSPLAAWQFVGPGSLPGSLSVRIPTIAFTQPDAVAGSQSLHSRLLPRRHASPINLAMKSVRCYLFIPVGLCFSIEARHV